MDEPGAAGGTAFAAAAEITKSCIPATCLLIGGWRGAYNTFLGGYCARCIENHLHWQLDVTFGEDQSRYQRRHGVENLALLRKLTLTLLKAHPAKLSLAKKRYAASLDPDFLEEIFQDVGTLEKP